MAELKPIKQIESKIVALQDTEVFRSGSSQTKHTFETDVVQAKENGGFIEIWFTISAAGGRTDVKVVIDRMDFGTLQKLMMDSMVNATNEQIYKNMVERTE